MFCGKCGTQNPDTAAFCKKCGTRLNNQAKLTAKTTPRVPVKTESQSKRPVPQNKRRQNKNTKKIAVVAIAAVVLMLAFVLFGGRSYKSTVKQYFDASFDGNAKKIINLLPDKMVDYALEESGYDQDELNELIEDVGEELKDYIDMLDNYLGDNWKATYKIANVEKVTGDDLEDIQKDYKKMDIKVSAAKEVELELTIKSGDTEQSNTMRLYLIKVGRSWYLDAGSMGLF